MKPLCTAVRFPHRSWGTEPQRSVTLLLGGAQLLRHLLLLGSHLLEDLLLLLGGAHQLVAVLLRVDEAFAAPSVRFRHRLMQFHLVAFGGGLRTIVRRQRLVVGRRFGISNALR